jgi:tripartite ATP-independent transporter DctP family solute receptor
MKRKFVLQKILIVLGLSVVLSACSASASAPQTDSGGQSVASGGNQKLAIAHSNNEAHKYHKSMLEFLRLIQEKSNGRYGGEVYPSTLGVDKDLFENLQMGTLEFAGINSGIIATGAPSIGIIDLPFLWKSSQHARNVLESPIGDGIKKEIVEKAKIIPLHFWENGFRCFTNNVRPIKTVADMKGLKFRVMEVALYVETFRDAWNSNPTPMAMSEVYSAMQTGVVDGHDNAADTVYTNSLYEVQKFYSDSRHIWGTFVFCVSPKFWDSLSSEDRTMFTEASKEATDFEWNLSATITEDSITKLRQLMSVTENDEIDIKGFVDSVQVIWKKYQNIYGADIINQIANFS